MAYGIEVLDSNNKTVFNSNNFCELIAYKATVVDGSWLAIPGWCYGQDQDVAGTNISVANKTTSAMTASGGQYANVYQIAFPYNGTAAQDYNNYKWDQYNVGIQYLSEGASYGITYSGTYPNGSFVYTNAYRIYTTTADVSSLRSSTSNRTLTPYTKYEFQPVIYARPQSGSYNGDFCMQTSSMPLVNAGSINRNDRYNRVIRILDKASGNNTFEIVVAMPAKDWGGVSGTKAHQAGTSAYGIEAFTAGSQQFHSGSTAGQFTTYSTLGRPSKVLLAKGVGPGSNSVATTSIGSLTSSSTKRYCRMTSTQYGHVETVSGTTAEYRQHYDWASNNSIGLKWTNIATASSPAHFSYSGRSTIIFDNYLGKQLFAIVDFGLGM